MKSGLSQVLCNVNKNDLISMVLLQQLKSVIKDFNVVFSVGFTAKEKTFVLIPINKDGETLKEIIININNNFSTLKTKHRDLYLVLLLTQALYNLDKKIYDFYSHVHFYEDQYVNLLLLSLTKSDASLNFAKNSRDVFSEIMYTNSIDTLLISKYLLHIDVKRVELVLSDDLYRYMGYKVKNKPCKGLKNSYSNSSVYGVPLTISADNNSSLDYFEFKINGYRVFKSLISLDMRPAFYLPLHVFEPIKHKEYSNENLKKQGYMLYDHQGFIQLVLKRIFQAIDLFNSREDLISPMWIKNQYKSISLPFSKNLLSFTYATKYNLIGYK